VDQDPVQLSISLVMKKIVVVDDLAIEIIDSKALPSYEQVAAQLGVGVDAVRMLIHRLRKSYTTLLRAEVARTVSDPEEIDKELHALCDVLIAGEGRLE
jgi:predicted methyltransferase